MSDFGEGFELEPQGERLLMTGPSGRVMLTELVPGTFLVTYESHAHVEFYRMLSAQLAARISDGFRLTLAVDMQAVKSYDTAFRKGWAIWLNENVDEVEILYILSGSKIVKMGINVINTVLKNPLVAYSEREAFNAVIRTKIGDADVDLHPRSGRA